MPIYDYNGSVDTEIGKIYDYNGSVNTQIGYVYDYNGTANSLIYTASKIISTGGSWNTWQGSYGASARELTGSTYVDALDNLDCRGYNTVSFTVSQNDAQMRFWAGNGVVYSSILWWQVWTSYNNVYIAGANYSSATPCTVSISGLTEDQKAKIRIRFGLTWSISTIDYSDLYGQWVLSTVEAS